MTQSNPKSSGPRSWTTKQLAWSCIGGFVAGAALLYGAGFHWLGQWQTGEEVAKQVAVATCVQDFLLQPERGVIYAELKNTTSSYQRRQLIRNRKLAESFDIAEQCDGEIRALDASHFEAPVEAGTEAKQPA
jgi:hypothetical protein